MSRRLRTIGEKKGCGVRQLESWSNYCSVAGAEYSALNEDVLTNFGRGEKLMLDHYSRPSVAAKTGMLLAKKGRFIVYRFNRFCQVQWSAGVVEL